MTASEIREQGTKRIKIETTIHEAAAKIREIIEQAETTVGENDGDGSEVETRILELVNE